MRYRDTAVDEQYPVFHGMYKKSCGYCIVIFFYFRLIYLSSVQKTKENICCWSWTLSVDILVKLVRKVDIVVSWNQCFLADLKEINLIKIEKNRKLWLLKVVRSIGDWIKPKQIAWTNPVENYIHFRRLLVQNHRYWRMPYIYLVTSSF